MPRYAQLVMGPAGAGKSTYVHTVEQHYNVLHRKVHCINLDPAAEFFRYEVQCDIRELISVDDVMEDSELKFGPNGGLVFCMEYLINNTEWLDECLGAVEDDYFIIDCPGQIELYTHMDTMSRFIKTLESWGIRVCAVYLLDSQFLVEPSKFIAGMCSALSAMVQLQLPHVNVLTKIDLLSAKDKDNLDRWLDPSQLTLEGILTKTSNKRHANLSNALCKLLDDYSLVHFVPLNIEDEDSIGDLCLQFKRSSSMPQGGGYQGGKRKRPQSSGGNQQQNFHQGGRGGTTNHNRGGRGGTPQRGGGYHGNNISPGFNRNDGGPNPMAANMLMLNGISQIVQAINMTPGVIPRPHNGGRPNQPPYNGATPRGGGGRGRPGWRNNQSFPPVETPAMFNKNFLSLRGGHQQNNRNSQQQRQPQNNQNHGKQGSQQSTGVQEKLLNASGWWIPGGGNQQQNFHQGGRGGTTNHNRGGRGGTPQRGGGYHGNNISPGFNRNDGG
eukprot:sb/3464111/